MPADLDFVSAVYDALYDENPAFGQSDVLALLTRGVVGNRTSADLARNAGSLDQKVDGSDV